MALYFAYVTSEKGHEAVWDHFLACVRNEKGHSAVGRHLILHMSRVKRVTKLFGIKFLACVRNEKGHSACEERRFVSKPLAKTQSPIFSVLIVAKSLPPLHVDGRNTKFLPKSVKLTAYI
jgi:hypothetical protein